MIQSALERADLGEQFKYPEYYHKMRENILRGSEVKNFAENGCF